MKLSLIITTYNWPESLLLVLKSINNQTILPNEVIIADDGSAIETKNVITSFKQSYDLNIIHSWQKDVGFRAARSRNNAILKSSGDYIVLIDGDVILHPKFVQDHIANAESGHFAQGTRVFLTKKHTHDALAEKKITFSVFSNGLMNRKNSIHSTILSKIFSNKKNHLRGIKSCNMAFYKKDCLNVNGFNNEFEGWGREDSEFAVRLINSGIKRKSIRFNLIQFHLWHNENTRVSLERNNEMLKDAKDNCIQWCENGINSLKNNES